MPSGRGAEGRAGRAGRAASSASSGVAEEADQEEQETQRWDVEQAFSHQGSGRMLLIFCWLMLFFFFCGGDGTKEIYTDIRKGMVIHVFFKHLYLHMNLCPFENSGPRMIYQNILSHNKCDR